MKTIFVVDDSDTNLSVVATALESSYRVMTLPSAAKMFSLLEKILPDLILLDIEMPELDGFAALKILKNNERTEKIPVMFLTGQTDAATESHGFDLGAIDFVAKPFSTPVLLNRIKMHLHIDELIRERTAQLEEKNKQLDHLYGNVMSILADMVESRDNATGGHIERTSKLAKILMIEMVKQDVYAGEIKEWNLELMVSSVRLHDLGKIAIPDSILNKPDKLTNDEYEIMKKHVEVGERIIDKIIKRTKEDLFWSKAKMFASYHHERWNGSGYPRGLKGLDIPLQGRILALIDVYDALVSERPYKKPFSHEASVEIIMSEAGKHFDPKIAEVFYSINDRFKAVKNEESNF